MEMSKANLKKVILVEYEFHYGFLYCLTKIFLNLGYQIDVYCSNEFRTFFLYKDKEYENINIISKHTPFAGTLIALKNSKNANIFIHFSVQAHKVTNFVRLLKPKAKLNILYTPRLSNWHEQKISLKLNRSAIIDNYFNIFRWIIKHNYDAYIVHSRQMVEKIGKNLTKKRVIEIPYTYRMKKPTKSVNKSGGSIANLNSPLRVVIPGSIDPKRRDYLSIFQVNQHREGQLSDVVIEFAGVPNGSDFSNNNHESNYFETLKLAINHYSSTNGCKFILHQKRLNEVEYNESIKAADVVLMPVNTLNYQLGGWSAGLAESIENDKIVLLPASYDPPAEYPSDFIKYKNAEDLQCLLERIMLDRSLAKLSQNQIDRRVDVYGINTIAARLRNCVE